MPKIIVAFFFGFLTFSTGACAQSILGKERPEAAGVLEGMASVGEGGVMSGACLRRTGDAGSEEFAVYFLQPAGRIEGFVVEFSGDDGEEGEIAANAGIVSFDDDGNPSIRGNLGLGWVADSYRDAVNFIRAGEMTADADYASALARVPTTRCPLPPRVR